MQYSSNIKPIVKWAGGKRQLLANILPLFPSNFNGTYYEPFLGGAALLLGFLPRNAALSDANEELISMYETVRDNPNELMAKLDEHEKNHNKDYYYEIRSIDKISTYSSVSKIEKAARMIYLNKTCFNGLYRVNAKGYFNTPIGNQKTFCLYEKDNILKLSNYLKDNNISLMCCDFAELIASAKENDFVYFDPPYDVDEESNGFLSYTTGKFSREEQERLKKECDKLNEKGIHFVLSNSTTDFIKDTYSNYRMIEIPAKRFINSKGDKRTGVSELIIYN